jgi:predicted double-glycine peptidase
MKRPILTCLLVLLLHSEALCEVPFRIRSWTEMKRDNINMQTLDYSCGAAALSILLQRYFGDNTTEKEILADIMFRLQEEELADRMQDGFSMLDLKYASARLGYEAEGITLHEDQLSHLMGPVIILLRENDIQHFVVLKGISGNKAFITDPVRGNIRMPIFALMSQWNGETLVVDREGLGLLHDHNMKMPLPRDAAPEYDSYRAVMRLR